MVGAEAAEAAEAETLIVVLIEIRDHLHSDDVNLMIIEGRLHHAKWIHIYPHLTDVI